MARERAYPKGRRRLAGRRAAAAFANLALALALVFGGVPAYAFAGAGAAYAASGDAGVAVAAERGASQPRQPGARVAAQASASSSEDEQAAADEVAALIAGLPDARDAQAGNRAAADKAKEAYDALTGDQKEQVGKELADKLDAVLAAIAAVEEAEQADRRAATDVSAQIAALPDPAQAGADARAAYVAAQAAYDALTDAQKELVPPADVQKLRGVGDAVKAAELRAADDQAAADEVIALISALPAATSARASDKDAADAAQAAYDALTDAQKGLVPSADAEKLKAVCAAAAAAQASEEKGAGSGSASGSSSSSATGSSGSSAAGRAYVEGLVLQWDEPDEFDMRHFVGDGKYAEEGYRTIAVSSFGQTVQLNGWYYCTDGTGSLYQTADSSTRIGSFSLTWATSDAAVATVSPDGLVTPKGKNGRVVITATVADNKVYQGRAPQTSVAIEFDGQEGRYVKKVEILDESGAVIGEDAGEVTVYDAANAFHQLQARVTWANVSDGAETAELTGQGDAYDATNVGTTLTWSVSSSTAFSINADTGRLRTGTYSGNAFVTCTAVGGKGGKDVTDTANVQLDTGVYEYAPADSLTLKVVWEERPDEVVKERTLTYDELMAELSSQHTFATVVNASRYGTISADGFLFKDVVGLVAVDDADVLQYRFQTADGYDNPVSYRYLFESGNRYYFPNYDLGGSRADGQIVPPLLAYRSVFQWNTATISPDAPLDESNRFRLVFGCLASGDANTSFQIYYIHGITVVLKGAPSAGDENAEDDSGDKPDKEAPHEGAVDQPRPDSAEPPADDERAHDKERKRDSQRKRPRGGPRSDGEDGGAQGERDGSGRDGGATADGDDEAVAQEGGGEGPGGAAGDAAKRWRVYQMMNKTNSDVPDWDDDNPLSPFAAPAVAGAFAVGAGATGLGFRRRLK